MPYAARIEIVCPMCGRSAMVRRYRPSRSAAVRYCSRRCALKVHGENHPNWNGGRSLRPDGYVSLNVDAHARALEHLIVAEKALGKPIPPGVEVHHFDENRAHNNNSNLVICESKSYHKLLHVRQRIAAAGGDPNTQKICGRCKRVKSRSSFTRHAANPVDGISNTCRECHNAGQRQRRIERKREDRECQKVGASLESTLEASIEMVRERKVERG